MEDAELNTSKKKDYGKKNSKSPKSTAVSDVQPESMDPAKNELNDSVKPLAIESSTISNSYDKTSEMNNNKKTEDISGFNANISSAYNILYESPVLMDVTEIETSHAFDNNLKNKKQKPTNDETSISTSTSTGNISKKTGSIPTMRSGFSRTSSEPTPLTEPPLPSSNKMEDNFFEIPDVLSMNDKNNFGTSKNDPLRQSNIPPEVVFFGEPRKPPPIEAACMYPVTHNLLITSL